MKLNEIATLILGVITLAWTIWTAIKSSREKKYLDRIDGLQKVKATLEALRTSGLDASVDQGRREESQKAQLETVSLALRRSSATYVSIIHKAVPSYLASLALFAYGFLAGAFTINVSSLRSASADQQLANEVAALVGAAVCIALIILGVIQWVRARRTRAVLRGAGIDLRGTSEKVAAAAVGTRHLLAGGSIGQPKPAAPEERAPSSIAG